MSSENTYAVGDRVWLKNDLGRPIMTGNSPLTRREVVFTVKAVNNFGYGPRYELDTHNSEARRRYCGGLGYSADALVKVEA